MKRLEELRQRREDLLGRARAKLDELKDDTPADLAKRIEVEHDEFLRQVSEIDTETAGIEQAERARLAPVPQPQPADEAAIRAQAQKEERDRVSQIRAVGDKLKVDRAFVDQHVSNGTSIAEFRTALIDHLAASQSQNGPVGPTNVRVDVTGPSEEEKRGQAMEIALLHRFDPNTYEKEFTATPQAREFRGLSLIELAREALEAAGCRTRGWSKMEIAEAALSMRSVGMTNGRVMLVSRTGRLMSTSDFPNILANVANKTLRAAYQAAPQTFRSIVRVTTVPAFKQVSRTQLGEAPMLERVNEHGEFKRGAMGEAVEKYSVATYGKIVGITRQVLVNDDLDAFTRISRAFGVQAANLESDCVWYQILVNANMNDGVALFHANHGNLAGSGGAISVSTVGAGREAMSKQKGLDGKTVLNIDAVYPATTPNVVPDSMRRLGVISEPRLDLGVTFDGVTVAGSATAWYLAADPMQIDMIELAYLEGAQGLYTETRMGFDVDGMEIKVRLDVGAKVIDHRGFYKDAGA